MSEPIPESIPTSMDPKSRRPAKRRALSPTSQQSAQLAALFKKPDRPISVEPPKPKTLPPPPEIVANVQGSSAGAGSGEFHVYKASRRRENERLKMMEEELKKEKEMEEFEKKKDDLRKKDDEKTEKNRRKREKKKQKGKGAGKKDARGDSEMIDGDIGGGIKPRSKGVNGQSSSDNFAGNKYTTGPIVEENNLIIHGDED